MLENRKMHYRESLEAYLVPAGKQPSRGDHGFPGLTLTALFIYGVNSHEEPARYATSINTRRDFALLLVILPLTAVPGS